MEEGKGAGKEGGKKVAVLGVVGLVVVVVGVTVCPFPPLLIGGYSRSLMIVIVLVMVLVEMPAVVALTCPSPSVHPCQHHRCPLQAGRCRQARLFLSFA